jgi:DNA-binding NarL/FixJ family response regulator
VKVLLVGAPAARARMRAALNGSIRVVAEFPTLEAAEAADVDADGILLASRVQKDPAYDPSEGNVGRVLSDPPDAEWEALTPREIDVLELLAEGLPNKAIAERLGISDQTVKFHVASIAGKLGASNRTDAVRRAVRLGLVTL